MAEEDTFFDKKEKNSGNKVFVLIIYDIMEDRKRQKLAKFLRGYGFRVQKSAFEAVLDKKKYHKLLKVLPDYADEEDSIRVYRITGEDRIVSFGRQETYEKEDIIVV